jgi:hypothetical protein
MANGLTVSLNANEVEALEEAISMAVDDQLHWIKTGDPISDYGSEWPSVARVKSINFRNMAELAKKAGFSGLAEGCIAVAESIEASVPDDNEDEIGTCVDCGAQCYLDGSLAVLCPACDGPKEG